MTPRQLKYFIEIARSKSFTRAAGVLHVAQPALSRQIQQLEDDLGIQLFRRTEAGVLLTEAGALLQQKAPALLEQYRTVREEVSGFAAQPRGKLHLGLPPSLFELLTVSLVMECTQRFPQLEISVVEDVSANLHDAVRGGRIDMAVVVSREPVTSLNTCMLVQEPMLLLSAPGGGMGEPVSVDDLHGLRLAATHWPNAMRMIVEDSMAARGVQAKYVLESSSSRLLLRVVESGWARTVLPYSAAAEPLSQARLSANPVEGLTVGWMVIYDRHRSAQSIDAVQSLICDQVRARVETGEWRGASLMA